MFSPQLLAAPELVLGVYCPVGALAVWHLAAPLRRRMPPRERFWTTVLAGLTPWLALHVPYWPDFPLRDVVPWSVPLSDGVSSVAVWSAPDWASWLLSGFCLVLLGSVAVSFLVGAAQLALSSYRLRRLPRQRREDYDLVDVPGFTALTAGALRPRVLLGREVVEGRHVDAVLAHERAHARLRHPLWIFAVRCVCRAWWWIPGQRALLAELTLAAELWADDEARRVAGARPLAEAIGAFAGVPAGVRPTAVAAGFGDSGDRLVRRARALSGRRRRWSGASLTLVWLGLAATVGLFVVWL